MTFSRVFCIMRVSFIELNRRDLIGKHIKRKETGKAMIRMRLVRLLSGAKKYIAFNILWQWIALAAQIAAVFAVTGLLQKAIGGGVLAADAGRAALVLLAALAVRFVCERQVTRASYMASVDVKRILRGQIYEKLLRLGASYRESAATSEVVQLCAEGVEQLETYFGKYLPQLFYSLLAPLTLFTVLVFVDWRSSLELLICVPLIPISIVVVQKIAKRLLSRYWGMYTSLGDSFLENLQGLTTLKIYQADEQKAQEMDEEAQKFRTVTMKVLTMQLNSTSVMDIVAYGGAAVGMVAAVRGYLVGRLTFAGALTIILLAAEFFIPLRQLGSYFHIAMNGMAASDKIFHLLDLPEPVQGSARLPVNADALPIRLCDVHFAYEQEREILKGISMVLPAHSFTALVGESGSGKSTIAGLLSGKNRSYTGSIHIGDLSLGEICETSLMQNVTLVRHNSYLFKGTVEENLLMAKPDASEAEMITVLERVNMWGFLRTQDGLSTRLLERAGNLSGGQCQRLALARALLHDSPVYIFDEATSNIDVESEELVMDVIRGLAHTKTVLLISHRLANVTEADCIYMLRGGEICERGTHEELLGNGGAYAKLYASQQELERYGQRTGKEAQA